MCYNADDAQDKAQRNIRYLITTQMKESVTIEQISSSENDSVDDFPNVANIEIRGDEETEKQSAAVISTDAGRKIVFYDFVMAVEIVLFHMEIRYRYSIVEDFCYVALFFYFFMSGFMCFKNHHFEPRTTITKRIRTIIVPYVLWNLIAMMIFGIIYVDIGFHSFKQFLIRMLIDPFDLPTWYLLTLFLFVLLTPFIHSMFRRRITTVCMILIAVAVNCLGWIFFREMLTSEYIWGEYLVRMALYFPAFVLGCFCGVHLKRFVNTGGIISSILGICGFAVITMIMLFLSIDLWLKTILYFVWFICTWMMIPPKVFAGAEFLKPNTGFTFFLFATHIMIIPFSEMLINGSTLLHMTGRVILTIAFSVIAYFLMKILLPSSLGVLTGNRAKSGKY